MQTLYVNKHYTEYFIHNSTCPRNHFCYSLSDPDLYQQINFRDYSRDLSDYIPLFTAEHITQELLMEHFPELFI